MNSFVFWFFSQTPKYLAFWLKVVAKESYFEGENHPNTKIFPLSERAYLLGTSNNQQTNHPSVPLIPIFYAVPWNEVVLIFIFSATMTLWRVVGMRWNPTVVKSLPPF